MLSFVQAGSNAARGPFRLTRYFSWVSLAGVVIVTVTLITSYRELTLRHLVDHETRAHADLTRAFTNAEWTNVREVLALADDGPVGSQRHSPQVLRLRQEVLTKMRGLSVVKVKLYNPAGRTVFSTDERQIGEDKSANPGLRTALQGSAVGNITFRDQFDAFEGVINQRNLIATYVPVRAADEGAVVGVFELYSDVTELLGRQHRAQWQMAGLVLTLLAALYLFLLVVVRRADRRLQRHDHERAQREAQIQHQAYHDGLTGLPNRASFAERLAQVAALARRSRTHGHRSALMFIDLDRFKFVNDSLGHEAGDQMLQEVARRLQACLRAGDQLFRTGGDEFTVLMPEIEAPQEAAELALRLQHALQAPVPLQEQEMSIGASIGIAVCPEDGTEAEDLLRNADAAMYGAKSLGRSTHMFYRDEMNQRANQRLALESALKQAVRGEQFCLHFQPRIDASTGRAVSLEALLRWQRPGEGLVLPGSFVPVLEDMPLMQVVGEWVLRKACVQLKQWHARGRPELQVSVNVSVSQFEHYAFPDVVRQALADSGLDGAFLELELTETMLIRRPEQAAATMAALKALGVRIAIDDFGTGYSSLNHLRQLPVDALKIDRSIVNGTEGGERDRAVATAIVSLARALQITVVAEGVETESQAAFFRRMGCCQMQGYLFSRPLPPEALGPALGTSPGLQVAPMLP